MHLGRIIPEGKADAGGDLSIQWRKCHLISKIGGSLLHNLYPVGHWHVLDAFKTILPLYMAEIWLRLCPGASVLLAFSPSLVNLLGWILFRGLFRWVEGLFTSCGPYCWWASAGVVTIIWMTDLLWWLATENVRTVRSKRLRVQMHFQV